MVYLVLPDSLYIQFYDGLWNLNGPKKIILLVEDEALIAILEIMELEKYEYIVHHVTTGEKAVQAIIDDLY